MGYGGLEGAVLRWGSTVASECEVERRGAMKGRIRGPAELTPPSWECRHMYNNKVAFDHDQTGMLSQGARFPNCARAFVQ